MHFQAALLSSITFALSVSAFILPRTLQEPDVLSISHLPESGQLVFTPLQFDTEGFELNASGEIDDALVDDWKTEVVKQHNAYRAHYGAAALTWSDALYSGTLQWAQQCKFQHSDGKGAYGENLAAGTGNTYGFSDGLKSWMDEASKYDYNHPGFSSGTGHFTQVVWKSSNQVACAIANCRGGTIFQQPSKYVVCRYTPPGNFAGRYVENVGRYK